MSGTLGQTNPFDSVISRLNFITSDGKSIDLRGIMVELDIFEDIFSNVISGKLLITDATNIFGHIVLQGSEYIDISFDKPSMNLPFERLLRVYGKPTIIQEKPTVQAITFAFCSEEMLLSKGMTFGKSYSNMLISDIAKNIMSDILKIPTNLMADIEPTIGISNLTIPNYNPLQALNWLASKARSTYVGASYLFFENKKGFNFKSIQKMMDIQNSVATYNCNIKNTTQDPSENFFDVERYEIIGSPNSLDSLLTGQNSGQLMTLDILQGKFRSYYFNGDDLYNSSVSLGNGRNYNNYQNRLGQTSATSYTSYRKFYPTNSSQNQNPYVQGKQIIQPTNVENYLIERNSQFNSLLANRIKMLIPGNNGLKAGDVITFNLPSVEPQNGNSEGETIRKLDPYMQGDYLITALRHKITLYRFETILEICRDDLAQALPNETTNIGSITT